MFNITSKTGKKRYQQEMVKRMMALERIGEKELKPILGRQYLNAAKFVEAGITDIDYAVDFESSRIKEAIEKQYRRCGTVFGNLMFDGLEEMEKGTTQAPFIKTFKEDFWIFMLAWIKKWGARKVVQVDDATKKAIRNTIDKGTADGKSYFKIAKDLRVIKEIATPVRSKRIARTEVHSSAMEGLHSAMRATGVKSEKEWLSTIDERIRGLRKTDQFNHIIANGERVAFEEKFKRTGEDLDYPGDPEGSAGNIIQCRCVQLFHVIRSYLKRSYRGLLYST